MSGNETIEEGSKKAILLRIMEVFGDLFVLNLIFILFSLPLFTIGASVSALYTMTFKLCEKREGALFSGFAKAFKKSFKQSTIIWFLIIVYFVILFAQYMFIINTAGLIGDIYIVVMFITASLGILTIPFIFPLIARYKNTIWKYIINSFLLSISNLWSCVKVVCLWVGTIAISLIYPAIFMGTWFLWLLVAFSLIAFLSSKIMLKIFEKAGSEDKNNN